MQPMFFQRYAEIQNDTNLVCVTHFLGLPAAMDKIPQLTSQAIALLLQDCYETIIMRKTKQMTNYYMTRKHHMASSKEINKKLTEEKKASKKNQFTIHTLSGLFTGAFCAAIFNPWDKALYLSVKHCRPFLSAENFVRPFQGVLQAISQRSFAWGSYYIAQGEMKATLYPYLREELGWSDSNAQLAIGMTAGSISAIVNNPLSMIKYHTWGEEKRHFISSVKLHLKNGSITSLAKGLAPTLTRDIIFGMFYESFRHITFNYAKTLTNYEKVQSSSPYIRFVSDMVAAGCGTILSSPFNYVRNMHYATPLGEKPLSTMTTLKQLYTKNSHLPLVSQMNIFRERFRIGWGTARVATGMATGQLVFDNINKMLMKK